MTQYPEKRKQGKAQMLKEPEPRLHKKTFWERNGWPIAAIIIFLALILPWVAWWQRSARTLNIKVIDKTVADRTFREHKGLFWILDHEKITKTNGTRYKFDQDYIGFEPLSQTKYQIREGDLASPADLVYIADTYGVYEEEFYGENKGNRTRLIYGGLQLEEIERIKESLSRGGTLVAEFNTFNSPTEKSAKDAMSKWLGVRWSGWMGRHFDDLKKGKEIPPWAIKNYEKQYVKEYDFKGPGFLFCNDKDEVLILEDKIASGPRLCEINMLPEAKEMFGVKGNFS